MARGIKFKEAKNKVIKRSFVCCLIAIILCWFMKLVGFDLFQLDLENKFFNDMSNFFNGHYWLKQLYFVITLNVQLYFMVCIVRQEYGKKIWLYLLMFLPITIGVRFLSTLCNEYIGGNWSLLIEFIYILLITSKFNYKYFIKSIITNVLVIVYQIISLNTRSLTFKSNTLSFIAEQIMNIDFYLLLYLTEEVALMDSGTWFFFGKTEWLYKVGGFIVGLFKGHPIKYAKLYGEKGKAKDDARKTKKENKRLAKGK